MNQPIPSPLNPVYMPLYEDLVYAEKPVQNKQPIDSADIAIQQISGLVMLLSFVAGIFVIWLKNKKHSNK